MRTRSHANQGQKLLALRAATTEDIILAKGQEFQTHLAETMSRVPQVIENIRALDKIGETRPGAGTTGTDAQATLHSIEPEANAALEDWRRQRA